MLISVSQSQAGANVIFNTVQMFINKCLSFLISNNVIILINLSIGYDIKNAWQNFGTMERNWTEKRAREGSNRGLKIGFKHF